MKNAKRVFSSASSRLLAIAATVALCRASLYSQQTLGGITGEVTDASGGVIPNASVTVTDEQTSLTRVTKTNGTGVYTFVNLPIGIYTLTYTAAGYEAQKTPHITVQADRTATVNASLKVGQATTTVEVEAAPLMNAVDTTNGYVMETQQIDAVPLPTGSFTGLAILSPGVNAEIAGRHRRQLRPGQRAHLGQRPARYFQRFSAQRRRRQQSLQRQKHQPGGLFPRREQHRPGQQRRRRRGSQRRLRLSGHRQRHPHAGAGDHRGSPRERFDVRRAAGLQQRRAHRHEHQVGNQPVPRRGLRASRHQLDQRRALLLQEGRQHSRRRQESRSCTATRRAATSAARSSRTSSSDSSATSTCTSPTRRPATSFSSCRPD